MFRTHFLKTSNFLSRLITSIVLGFLFWLLFFYLSPIFFSALLCVILLLIIFFEWSRFFKSTSFLFWAVMPLYPILPFSLLILLNHVDEYRFLLVLLFITVFSFDTGSYIVGNLIGEHPLSLVSKGKTWEGVCGGYFFAIGGLLLIFYEYSIYVSWISLLLFAFIVSMLALLGDLFESWLKRKAAIKDSGNLLPGHGGFLDRFDGILFVVFFIYFFRDIILLWLA
jgi:phosphatidate cytidylyltransferase